MPASVLALCVFLPERVTGKRIEVKALSVSGASVSGANVSGASAAAVRVVRTNRVAAVVGILIVATAITTTTGRANVRIEIVELLPRSLLPRSHRVVARRQRKFGAASKAIRQATILVAAALQSAERIGSPKGIGSEGIWPKRMQGPPSGARVGCLEAIEFVAAFELGAGKSRLKQFDGVAKAGEPDRVGAARVFEFATPAGVVAVIERDATQVHVGTEVGAAQQQYAFELAAGGPVPAEFVREEWALARRIRKMRFRDCMRRRQ